MKANELVKRSLSIETIYKEIESINKVENNQCQNKHFIHHWFYVCDSVKARLINDGFKVYNGEFARGDYGLIIEW